MHKNCSKLCSSILTFISHYLVLQHYNFLLEGTFSLEKWKSNHKMMDSQKHVLSKIVKNEVLYHKSFQMMLYIKVTEIIVVVTLVILNFSESRNKDDKFGSFVAAQVNELVCTWTGRVTYGQRYSHPMWVSVKPWIRFTSTARSEVLLYLINIY